MPRVHSQLNCLRPSMSSPADRAMVASGFSVWLVAWGACGRLSAVWPSGPDVEAMHH